MAKGKILELLQMFLIAVISVFLIAALILFVPISTGMLFLIILFVGGIIFGGLALSRWPIRKLVHKRRDPNYYLGKIFLKKTLSGEYFPGKWDPYRKIYISDGKERIRGTVGKYHFGVVYKCGITNRENALFYNILDNVISDEIIGKTFDADNRILKREMQTWALMIEEGEIPTREITPTLVTEKIVEKEAKEEEKKEKPI